MHPFLPTENEVVVGRQCFHKRVSVILFTGGFAFPQWHGAGKTPSKAIPTPSIGSPPVIGRRPHMVNKRVVHILLECILVATVIAIPIHPTGKNRKRLMNDVNESLYQSPRYV